MVITLIACPTMWQNSRLSLGTILEPVLCSTLAVLLPARQLFAVFVVVGMEPVAVVAYVLCVFRLMATTAGPKSFFDIPRSCLLVRESVVR